MTTEREQILALAVAQGAVKDVLLHGRHDNVVFTSGELEAFYNAARKPLEDEIARLKAERAAFVSLDQAQTLLIQQREKEKHTLIQQLAEAKEDRDEFQAVITAIGVAATGYDFSGGLAEYVKERESFAKLAASQAREAKLREWMPKVTILGGYEEQQRYSEALTLPPDDIALRNYGANLIGQVLERMIADDNMDAVSSLARSAEQLRDGTWKPM